MSLQVKRITQYLIRVGLADDYRFPILCSMRGGIELVTFAEANRVSVALGNAPYNQIYEELMRSRAYNVRIPSGALIQLMYKFSQRRLLSHRLAFFPPPHLNEAEEQVALSDYEDDDSRGDAVVGNFVPFPVRFDYNSDANLHKELVHPKCHLTLGQYENCRIPVMAPLMPNQFMDFVLRNFYDTGLSGYADGLPSFNGKFGESITCRERSVIHIGIPRGVGP